MLFEALILPSASQQLTLTGNSQTVPEADDYFTDILQKPKSFDSNCDIGFDQFQYYPKGSQSGVWTGEHRLVSNPILGFLPIPTMGTNLAVYREDCQELGLHEGKKINAAKYSQLSWKIKNSQPSSFAFLWTKNTNNAIYGYSAYDGYYLPAAGVPTATNTWAINKFYIPSVAPTVNPWSGEITGMSLWPSAYQPANGVTSIDWIRLIDPSTATPITLSWSYSAGAPAGKYFVALYVDENSSGYDGIAMARFLPLNGSYDFDTGQLPPGTYYLYAQLELYNNSAITGIQSRSNYIGPVTINAKPILKFTAPSRTSGKEYSRDERKDSWDMNQATDLVNLVDAAGNPTPAIYRGLHGWSFQNGYFYATSDEDPVGFTVDTQVHFTVAPNKPVDTNYYRYFCYKMQIDSANIPRDGNVDLLNRAGWVTRFMWLRKGVPNGFGSTGPQELVERSTSYPDLSDGLVTYCYDLWDDTGFESGIKWRDVRFVDVVRFDPMEAMPETNFVIDWAGLFAENADNSKNKYLISWNLTDAENDLSSISFYYDTDRTGFDGNPIITLNNQTPGAGSYVWNTTNVASGSYYIYAIVTDAFGNQGKYYSDVVVHAGTAGKRAVPLKAACDFDGDGKSDFTVIRKDPQTRDATIFTRYSSNSSLVVQATGSTKLDLFLDADFDGDLVSDIGFARALRDPVINWFHTYSSSSQPASAGWGIAGDLPIIADIDGDSIDDRLVFRNSDASWWALRSSLYPIALNWGIPGDFPVIEDYDGDHWDDIGVYRPATGMWYILQSSKGASSAPNDIIAKQWGLPGDHPMPGDYDGDGKADLAVFRPVNGTWYICYSSTGFNCKNTGVARQFGLPGDMPIKGDFDGDKKLDPAVYRGSSGFWFYQRSSNNQAEMVQFGLPGDIPLCYGIADEIQLLAERGGPDPVVPKRRRR